MDDHRVGPAGRILTRPCSRRAVLAGLAVAGLGAVHTWSTAGAAAVRPERPRLLLDAPTLTRLKGRQTAADASWQALKTRADTLATYRVLKYEYDTRTDEPDNTIFYDYQGEGWFGATMPLALAFQMTGDARYADK